MAGTLATDVARRLARPARWTPLEIAFWLIALGHGFAPDTISTDLHAYSGDSAVSLPAVLAKLIGLGLGVEAALAAATLAPARAVRLDRDGIGTLRVGSAADLALFAVAPGELRPRAVWRRGALVCDEL